MPICSISSLISYRASLILISMRSWISWASEIYNKVSKHWKKRFCWTIQQVVNMHPKRLSFLVMMTKNVCNKWPAQISVCMSTKISRWNLLFMQVNWMSWKSMIWIFIMMISVTLMKFWMTTCPSNSFFLTANLNQRLLKMSWDVWMQLQTVSKSSGWQACRCSPMQQTCPMMQKFCQHVLWELGVKGLTRMGGRYGLEGHVLLHVSLHGWKVRETAFSPQQAAQYWPGCFKWCFWKCSSIVTLSCLG